MKKQLFTLVLGSFFLVGCAQQTLQERSAVYKKKAAEVIKLSKSNASKAKIISKTNELMAVAIPMVKTYRAANPECTAYLNKTLNDTEVMINSSLEDIEKLYHHGEALPPSPDKCYDAKDLVVHPATVIVLAKNKFNDEGREQMVAELEEVLMHVDNVLE